MQGQLYAANCSPLLEADILNKARPFLDTARSDRIDRLLSVQKKAQCACAGLLLYHLFSLNGQPPRLWHNSRGKPYLTDFPALFFNLSHTADWVLCAVADGEIGLDAQCSTAYNAAVVQRCFTEKEKAYLAADKDAFTRLWACKEAYLKMIGCGLALPMGSFSVPEKAQGQDDENHCHWHTTTLNNAQIALCTQKPMTLHSVEEVPVSALLKSCQAEAAGKKSVYYKRAKPQ